MFVGLDLETSGVDVDAGAVPIQLGMSLGGLSTFSELIGWNFAFGQETWDGKAAEIHKIPLDDVRNAPSPDTVARMALGWLPEHKERSLIGVGWNVGTFDFPFIARYMPSLARSFQYRFVDLNAVCFTLGMAGNRGMNGDQAFGYKAWKNRAKKAAEQMIGTESRWHDAGYDAAASLFAWWYLCDHITPRPK